MFKKLIRWITGPPQVYKTSLKRGDRITTAAQIKEIIEPIPSKMLIPNEFGSTTNPKGCVLGHINRALSPRGYEDYTGDRNGFGARELSAKYLQEKGARFADIADVNNRSTSEYCEETPKERVMHLVDDMITAGY